MYIKILIWGQVNHSLKKESKNRILLERLCEYFKLFWMKIIKNRTELQSSSWYWLKYKEFEGWVSSGYSRSPEQWGRFGGRFQPVVQVNIKKSVVYHQAEEQRKGLQGCASSGSLLILAEKKLLSREWQKWENFSSIYPLSQQGKPWENRYLICSILSGIH